MRDRMVGGGLMALALVALIGCSSSTGSAAPSAAAESAAPSVAAPSEAAPSEAAPSEAAPSEAAASGLIPSFVLPSSDKELEALIPSTLCGSAATKLSLKGQEIFANNEDQTLTSVLQSLGKSVDDVSAAAGFNVSATNPCGVFIIRIKGASEDQLRTVFQQLADQEGTKFQQTSLGGKTVYKSTTEDKPQYVWIKGDGLISVSADSEADAATLIGQLP
jgi:hypothetical protein